MISMFTLFFFSGLVHLIYSCMTLEPYPRNIAIVCDCALFLVPLAVFISGRLRRAMPYILISFYAASCFVMSVINRSVIYLPLLFACAVVVCGFFLSVKLCIWHTVVSDALLIVSMLFFLTDEAEKYTIIYLIMCFCYSFSCVAMVLFVYATRKKLVTLRKENKELVTAANRKNVFWAAVSSKMRGSAVDLSGFCNSTLKDKELPPHLKERIGGIRNDVKRLLVTLKDAEDYAKIESKRMKIFNAPYSFSSLVSDISNFCSAACTNERIHFSIECQRDIPSVLIGDSERISQIIMTLFENSVKFTKSGSITIEFSARPACYGVNLQIRVRDTGIGINDSTARKMFTVYTERQGGDSLTHTGLGIAKNLVTLMGGFIFVRQERQGGSCFVVTVPQGVKNNVSFAAANDPENIHVLCYMRSEQTLKAAQEQLEQMEISAESCISRADFMLKKDNTEITHIFTDYPSYLFDKPIFRILARRAVISVVCGVGEGETNLPTNIKRVLKPLHMATFAHIFNNGLLDMSERLESFSVNAKAVIIGAEHAELSNALQYYGIQYALTDCEKAVETVRLQQPDIIFIVNDSDTVNLNTRALEKILAEEKYRELPVITLGETLRGCTDCLPLGCDRHQIGEVLLSALPEGNINYRSGTSELKPQYGEFMPERGITNAGGSKSAYKEMLEIFRGRAEETVHQLETAPEIGDYSGCALQLQALKTSAANIGAVSAAEIARQAQSAAERQDYALLQEMKGILFLKLVRLRDDILLYLSDNGIKALEPEQTKIYVRRALAALKEDKSEVAEDILGELLGCYLKYEQRIALKAAVNYINEGNIRKAVSGLEGMADDE